MVGSQRGFSVFVLDNMGKLVFVLGAALFFVGLLASTQFGTVLSAATLFSGILLLVFGLFSMLGLFSTRFRSLTGVSMLLICVAITLFAFAIVALQFLQIVSVTVAPVYDHGHRLPFSQVILETSRSFVWLSDLCGKAGLVFLVLGLGFRVASAYRH